MISFENNDRNKRKRDDACIHDDDSKDKSTKVETPMAACIDESYSELTSFLEFRRSTIKIYPSLNWLGPSVMAVYWFKEYLKNAPFDWVRCPKQNQQSLPSPSSSNRDDEGRSDQERRRKRQRKSKGHFYFIPGQYLRIVGQKIDTIARANDLAVQTVLDFGTPSVHYATSYIGVYNLLRSYGKFAINAEYKGSKNICETELKRQSGRLHYAAEGNPIAFPVQYNGPPLPK